MTPSANSLHQEILSNLKKYSGQGTKHSANASYLGNTHFSYNISNPIQRSIIKEFIKNHPDISFVEFSELLDLLFASNSHDEKSIAGMLIGYFKIFRNKIDPQILDIWLNHLKGWAEIDSLCQSNFTAEEMLSK